MAGNDLEAVAEAAKTTVELLRIAHGALHSRETKSFVQAVVKSHAAVRKQDRHVAINHGAAGGRGGGMARARDMAPIAPRGNTSTMEVGSRHCGSGVDL
jgi:hypothetical protein